MVNFTCCGFGGCREKETRDNGSAHHILLIEMVVGKKSQKFGVSINSLNLAGEEINGKGYECPGKCHKECHNPRELEQFSSDQH